MKLITYLQIQYNLARRKIIQLIKNQDISINWNIVEDRMSELQVWDRISVDMSIFGKASIKESIRHFPQVEAHILLYHKPRWYIVSKEKQEKWTQTIYDILPKEFENRDYIWRLDKDSSGLLLMTNDKSIINKLWHPSADLIKTYHVIVDKKLSDDEVEEAKKWVRVDDFGDPIERWPILKFEDIVQYQNINNVKLVIKLKQWYKRHIRRVLRYMWCKIFKLHRTGFGKYKIADIKVGEYQIIPYT